MKQIEATNVVKTLSWIAEKDTKTQAILEPKLNKEGIYECIITLPLIKKTVIGMGDNKLESIDNATKQTAKLIDEYDKGNKDQVITILLEQSDYILEEDDAGCLCMHVLPKNIVC